METHTWLNPTTICGRNGSWDHQRLREVSQSKLDALNQGPLRPSGDWMMPAVEPALSHREWGPPVRPWLLSEPSVSDGSPGGGNWLPRLWQGKKNKALKWGGGEWTLDRKWQAVFYRTRGPFSIAPPHFFPYLKASRSLPIHPLIQLGEGRMITKSGKEGANGLGS